VNASVDEGERENEGRTRELKGEKEANERVKDVGEGEGVRKEDAKEKAKARQG
jgi:hypothetical protein